MNTGSSDNRTCNVLVLGDSHVYWLEQFIAHDLLLLRYPQPAHGVNAIDIEYGGTRGGTVSSMRRDAVFRSGGRDLPHAVILMVGGNDLDKCGHVTVCQVLRRNSSWRNFSYQEGANRVSDINEFLLAACSEPGKVAFWKHRALWLEGAELFRHDGVHYNSLGNFKLYNSVRGAIFQAGRLCQPHSLVVSTKYNVGPTCIIIMCTYKFLFVHIISAPNLHMITLHI